MQSTAQQERGVVVAPRVSSPVLILGGPSPAVSELSARLRSLDVKVLHAPNGEMARKSAAEESPRVLLVDARSSRRIPEVEKTVADVRQQAGEMAALVWFDVDIELADVVSLCEPLDDHMAGTIDVEESIRRLHMLTARLPERREGERLVVGDLELDTSARTVTRGGRDIDLSDTEFRLLRLLMRHARTVLPKSEILQEVWEYEFAGQANIVELYISYVRKKIEADMPRMIHTVRGAGYVLRPAETPESEAPGSGELESETPESGAPGSGAPGEDSAEGTSGSGSDDPASSRADFPKADSDPSAGGTSHHEGSGESDSSGPGYGSGGHGTPQGYGTAERHGTAERYGTAERRDAAAEDAGNLRQDLTNRTKAS